MMWGKHYAQMYEGSMIGAGAVVFAVWGYVISKQVPDKVVGSHVHLNPDLLAFILGEKPDEVRKAIEFLEAPDSKSTTKVEGGRRLVKVGEFDYRVVNGMKYLTIRNEEERREQNRVAQEKFRKKGGKVKTGGEGPLPGEAVYGKAHGDGDEELCDHLASPEAHQ